MKNFKNLIYSITCFSFTVIFGAAVYEHLAVWPTAFSNPSVSLTMFTGEYGLDGGKFWRVIHPITLILFLITLFFTWKTERRKFVLIPLIGYVIIMVFTTFYFVPELFEIVGTKDSIIASADLKSRGQLWINLSLLRLFAGICLILYLYQGLTKSAVSESAFRPSLQT